MRHLRDIRRGVTDGQIDGPKDRQSLLQRCDDASNRSPKGNMWSAIPIALLCILVIVGDGQQGSGPKGNNVL